MILQALARYYDILLNDDKSEIAPPGYSTVGVSYSLNLSVNGELLDVFPLGTEERGRKTSRRMRVPEQVNHTNKVSAFFLCDNSTYVLGISDREEPSYGVKRFNAFRQFNVELLEKAHCPSAKALTAFLENYDPMTSKDNPVIAESIDGLLDGGRIVFQLQGQNGFIHNDPTILRVWENFKAGTDAVMGQCLVTGETSPIARLHPSLQGIRGAPSTGVKLVSFNERAYESYNRVEEQGLNSPVSEKMAFAYTKVINHLLSDANDNKKFFVGDTTVVYWAESDNNGYAQAFMRLCEPEMVEIEENPTEVKKLARDKTADKKIKSIANKVRKVQALDVKGLREGLTGNPRFYILGLAPNKSRAVVRFYHSDPFDKVVEKIMQHYEDLKIDKEYEDQPTYLTVQRILDECASKKITDKAERQKSIALLAGSTFRAILENTLYPAALYNAVLIRIRADMDSEDKKKKEKISKINYTRAAIVKAYLLRKYRNQSQHPIQEVLVMSLNEQSTHPAYILGRLFAVLERAQIEAAKPAKLDSTIKDRYFSSACASPATVFPVLLRLSQHHISKAQYGHYYDKQIGEILNLLDVENNPIPSRLTLDDQGVFVIGYYHQRGFRNNSNDTVESTSSETK